MGEVVGASYTARYVQNVLDQIATTLPDDTQRAIVARADHEGVDVLDGLDELAVHEALDAELVRRAPA